MTASGPTLPPPNRPDDRWESQLASIAVGFAETLRGVPLQSTPPLPPDWLRVEMLERFLVLRHVGIVAGSSILEVGSGPHAIATVPLAFETGPTGSIVAAEPSRWGRFREIVAAAGMAPRVRPVRCDARQLPLAPRSVDLSVCLHGIRSLGGPDDLQRVVREMFRVSPRIALAETLPIATTDAQRAHLAMYDLRHEVFEHAFGRRDDLPYPSLAALAAIVESVGGGIESTRVLEIDLPHALAHFPRSLIEGLPEGSGRTGLLQRWDDAHALAERFGTDHPPVGLVIASSG